MTRTIRMALAAGVVLAAVLSLLAGCGSGPSVTVPPAALAAKIKAALVTDIEGLGDRSLNDLSYAGLQRAQTGLGVTVQVLESRQVADYAADVSQVATGGYSPVFAVGVLMTDTVSKLATRFPGTDFAGVDESFDHPPRNVLGLDFKEQEGAYLAGVLAAMATTDRAVDPRINPLKVVGFVGGLTVPRVQRYEAGYRAGVASVDPSIKVVSLYAGTFTDPAKGKELGLSEIGQGADIVFAAAGPTGGGAFDACRQGGALFIGADSDQAETIADSGGTILTSVVKRADVAVYDTVADAAAGTFRGGRDRLFGLKEGGVALAPFRAFGARIPSTVKDALAKARADIVAGRIVVPDKV